MPPRKEPKETVFYPPSKQKAPPFKPLRPSTLPRTSTTDSESAAPKRTAKPPQQKRRKTAHTNYDDNADDSDAGKGASERDSDASEDLPANPLNATSTKATKHPAPRPKSTRQPSPMSISSEEGLDALPVEPDAPLGPSQSDTIPSIPQPLLIRLFHEHFADKNTKIDKHAIQVLQRYFEIFVRETIARAMARKKEEGEADGGMDAIEASWLELEDLEKVAAGMMLDF